jgi:iron complex outermembrane receptor protein
MKSEIRFQPNYVFAAIAAGVFLTAPYAAAQAVPSEALERVTITAEKRLTVLDKTPEAISAISGSRLSDMGATGLEDVVGLVPNASLDTNYGTAKISIRGVGINTTIGEPGVATYIDGAYVSELTSANTGMFDLQRVEVLRGPQGALYGRNATGGAVNYVTARPTETFQGQANVTVGDYGRRELDGYFSGPLGSSSTSARLSYKLNTLDGYTSNTVAGQSFAPVLPGNPGTVGPNKLDDKKTQAFRLQTATDFGDAGNLRLILANHTEDDTGPNIAALPQAVVTSALLYGATPGSDRFTTSSNGQTNKVDASALQAIYERPVGSNTLTVGASYRKSKRDFFLDSDSTPALASSINLFTDSTDQSLDVHIASEDGAQLQWLVGGNYLEFERKQGSNYQVQLSTGLITGRSVLNALPTAFSLSTGGTTKTRATALYTDLRYAITTEFALRGGLRLSQEQKDVSEYNTSNFTGTKTATPSGSWNSVPGNIGAEWNLSKETMLYGKLSKGFKSGAINVGLLQSTTVNPETVVSTELGMKTSFLNNRGAFSAAVFSSDYKDMQFSQIDNLGQTIVNAPGAKITGLEFEFLIKPVSSLVLGANIGLMDPKFTDYTNKNTRTGLMVNVGGNQITNVSKAQASLSADYSQSVGDYQATLRADYVWRDKYYFTEFNEAVTMQDAYGMLNLAASMRPVGAKWKLYAQLKNAMNTVAYTDMQVYDASLATQRAVAYTPPRTLGVGLSIDF